MIGPVDRPHEFVFAPDVGPVVVRLLDTPAAFGRAWNLGGAGATTQLELARMAFGGTPRFMAAGKTIKVNRISRNLRRNHAGDYCPTFVKRTEKQ